MEDSDQRTLTQTQTGFSSKTASGKQVSSGPHQGEVPQVQVRSGLLGASSVRRGTKPPHRGPADSGACPESTADLAGDGCSLALFHL